VWPCANKTLFTKTGSRLDSAQVRLPDLAKKNPKLPVGCEFQINNRYMF
jgi:hypothetical protein